MPLWSFSSKKDFITSMSLGVLLIATSAASAQTVTTDPVGFTTKTNLASSDTYVSLPLTRPTAFIGAVQSISGSTITVSGSPGFAANQFVYTAGTQPNHYYLLVSTSTTSDPKEGHSYAVTANGTSTLTVDTTADNLTGLPLSTQIKVIPYWTLSTLFPAANAGISFTATTTTRTFQTEVLIPDYTSKGTNLAFTSIYFFSNNVNGSTNNIGWRLVNDNTATSHDNDPLLPDGYIVVRNNNSAPSLPLSIAGAVETKKVAVPLATSATAAQDNSVAMIRPVDVSLNNTGLTPNDGSFVATTTTRTFKDELLVYNNATAAINKSPSAIYFYSNNVNGSSNNVGWRLINDATTTDHGSDLIPAGTGFIIRKASLAGAPTVYWTNSPTY